MKQIVLTALLLTGSAFALPTYSVTVTAYNPDPRQTDSTPFITATGTRTREGIIALSRDMLSFIPYGSVVRLSAVKGPSCGGFSTGNLRVEDTMNARYRMRADVVLMSHSAARNWGICQARLTVVKRAR